MKPIAMFRREYNQLFKRDGQTCTTCGQFHPGPTPPARCANTLCLTQPAAAAAAATVAAVAIAQTAGASATKTLLDQFKALPWDERKRLIELACTRQQLAHLAEEWFDMDCEPPFNLADDVSNEKGEPK